MKLGMLSCTAAVGIPVLAGLAIGQQEAKQLTPAELKATVVALGYEAKDLNTEVGKEKYEFTVKTEGFNIPMGAEISPSKNYIWLTANLGAVKDKTDYKAIVQAHSQIQPCQFYTTKSGNLMMALAVENHGVTSVWMKKCIEKISGDIDDQAAIWNIKE